MSWLDLVVLWIPLALRACVLVLLSRGLLHRRFPLFTLYIAYTVVVSILKIASFSSSRAYFYVFWISEPGDTLLSVLAVYESFMRVFGDFYRIVGFRLLFPGTIAMALIYAAWKAYAHPVHASVSGAIIISTAIAAQYVILGISVLFFLLVRFIHVQWRLYEFRIVLGFAVASLVYVVSALLRSESGTRFALFTRYAPGVAYIVAAGIWLSAMWAEEPKPEEDATGMLDEQLLDALRLHLRGIKKLLGKGN